MTARRLKPAATAILQQLRQSEIIGSDETGLRCEGRNSWLWVLQNEQASYFAAVSRRSGQVLHDLLGDCRIPLWVSDLYAGQLNAPAEQFAVCNAHQLRELQYAIDCGDPVFAPSMQMLLREGLLLTRQRDLWHTDRYTAAVDSLKHCAHSLIDGPSPLPITRRLQNRFRKHFDKIWRFLDDPRVPFDNNASERALRPAVIHRKVVGGFRSLSGAEAYACYRTVEDTARKRKQPIWDALFAALGRPLSLPLRLAF
jgi:transposase